VSAPLREFLTEESDNELTKVAIAVALVEEIRLANAVAYPGPAPEPMTLPPGPPPESEVETKVLAAPPPKKGVLARLKIDRTPVPPITGATCPGCNENRLIWAIVLWPGARRPSEGPDMTWWCRWCRQYYVEE
jgi:hypothetical protein